MRTAGHLNAKKASGSGANRDEQPDDRGRRNWFSPPRFSPPPASSPTRHGSSLQHQPPFIPLAISPSPPPLTSAESPPAIAGMGDSLAYFDHDDDDLFALERRSSLLISVLAISPPPPMDSPSTACEPPTLSSATSTIPRLLRSPSPRLSSPVPDSTLSTVSSVLPQIVITAAQDDSLEVDARRSSSAGSSRPGMRPDSDLAMLFKPGSHGGHAAGASNARTQDRASGSDLGEGDGDDDDDAISVLLPMPRRREPARYLTVPDGFTPRAHLYRTFRSDQRHRRVSLHSEILQLMEELNF